MFLILVRLNNGSCTLARARLKKGCPCQPPGVGTCARLLRKRKHSMDHRPFVTTRNNGHLLHPAWSPKKRVMTKIVGFAKETRKAKAFVSRRAVAPSNMHTPPCPPAKKRSTPTKPKVAKDTSMIKKLKTTTRNRHQERVTALQLKIDASNKLVQHDAHF